MDREHIQECVLAAMPLISCFPRLSLSLSLSLSLRAGPFLNFLALHEQHKQANSEKFEALKMTFWPFAVAGGFL